MLQLIVPSNEQLSCIAAVKADICTEIPDSADLPLTKKALQRNPKAINYINRASYGQVHIHKRNFLLFYPPRVYPLRLRKKYADLFWLENCKNCDKRKNFTCLANPRAYAQGSCPLGIRPREEVVHIDSPWPTLVLHVALDWADNPIYKIYTPLEHTEDMEYMAFKTLYTGHTNPLGKICFGSVLSSRTWNTTPDFALHKYDVATLLTTFLTGEFVSNEYMPPGCTSLEDWLHNLSERQLALRDIATNNHDIHLFKVPSFDLDSGTDGSPVTAILTDTVTSNFTSLVN